MAKRRLTWFQYRVLRTVWDHNQLPRDTRGSASRRGSVNLMLREKLLSYVWVKDTHGPGEHRRLVVSAEGKELVQAAHARFSNRFEGKA